MKHALGGPIEIKCRDYNELPDDYPRAFCDGVECRYLGGMPLELNELVHIRVCIKAKNTAPSRAGWFTKRGGVALFPTPA